MLARLAPSLLLGAFATCFGSAGLAQTPGNPSAEVPGAERAPAERREVVMGVAGSLDPDARATLLRLLRAELEPHGLVLVENDPSDDARTWADEALRGDERLLGVLLDTNESGGWRLVVIDPARGRAISRELPGGARNAANVEAIVSIVVSATNALREGLEVASAPLEAVVGANPPKHSAPPSEPMATKAPAPPAASSSGTSLHGGLSALVASLSESAEPTVGGSLTVGASIASLVDVDLTGAAHLPRAIDSSFGNFTLRRTSLSLGAGPALRHGAFTFVPALGATAEWLVRSETHAASGVVPGNGSETTPRIGGELALRGRYALVEHRGAERVSVLGALGVSYFGDEVRFLAGDETLAVARHTVFSAGLGVFIATDPL